MRRLSLTVGATRMQASRRADFRPTRSSRNMATRQFSRRVPVRRSRSSTPTMIRRPRATWVCSAASLGCRPARGRTGASPRSTRAAAVRIRGQIRAGRWRSRSISSGRTRSHPVPRSCWSRRPRTASATCLRRRTTRRRTPSTSRTAGAAPSSRVRQATTRTFPGAGSVSSFPLATQVSRPSTHRPPRT